MKIILNNHHLLSKHEDKPEIFSTHVRYSVIENVQQQWSIQPSPQVHLSASKTETTLTQTTHRSTNTVIHNRIYKRDKKKVTIDQRCCWLWMVGVFKKGFFKSNSHLHLVCSLKIHTERFSCRSI